MKSNTIRFSLCFLLLDLAAAPQAVLISSDSLRGDLSFLASDLLEGRDTPSRGLDLAAEYIAAQFRRTALQPVGDNGYFQTAHMLRAAPADDFELRASDGSRRLAVSKEKAAVVTTQPLDLSGVRIYKVAGIADLLNGVKRQVVALDAPPARRTPFSKPPSRCIPRRFSRQKRRAPCQWGTASSIRMTNGSDTVAFPA